MEKYVVLVVGRGKLAAELLNGLGGQSVSRVLPWHERDNKGSGPCMVVHAGSGRELEDVAEFCANTGSPLLELSTAGAQLPPSPVFPIIICPNVNMQMLSFMAMVKQAVGYFKGQDIVITESHQATKTSKPGTAIHLAGYLGVPDEKIRSIRDPKVQSKTLHIPDEFLARHAYHEILMKSGEVEIRLETQVLGKSAYATGLGEVIGIIAHSLLRPGVHDVVDLVISDAERRTACHD
jgi:hypothetical protein